MIEDEKLGKAIVEAVDTIAAAVRDVRRRMRESGGQVDSTAIAGVIARELRARKGSLAHGIPARLRHPFEERPLDDPTGMRGAGRLVVDLTEALRRPRDEDALLDDVGRIWPQHANRGEADRAIDALQEERRAAQAAKDRAAHEERLRIAKHASAQPQRPPGPRPLPSMQSPHGEGEYVVGDDFTADVPLVG